MEETARVDQRKPLLTVEQQIEHLKSKGVRMKNPRIRQIATLMYLHTQLVPEGSGKKSATSHLESLEKKLFEMSDLAPANDTIRSAMAFLAKLIDSWFR